MTDKVTPTQDNMPHLGAYIEQLGLPETLEDAIKERDFWVETAAQFSRNEDYYRGLLDKIAEQFGPEVYIADDGSVSDSPLRAKLPELAARHASQARTEGMLIGARLMQEAKDEAFQRSQIINAPEDVEILAICERIGFGAVMDSAMRQWIKRDPMGAFYIGGCLAFRSPEAIVEGGAA